MVETNTSRRKFLTLSALTAAGAITKAGAHADSQDRVFSKIENNGIAGIERITPTRDLIRPPALKKGSLIAITAPASPTNAWEMRHSVKTLKNLGFKVEIGRTITDRDARNRYLAAPDEMRAAEFMHFVERADVDCILCGRGGYGVMRILDILDYDVIAKHPKIIIGFSDITALLIAITVKTGVITFHGPVAATEFNCFTIEHFMNVLYFDRQFKPIATSYPTITVMNGGKAAGRITGGNLSMIVSTLGTPFEIDTKDSILLIEEVSEHPYKIDKMLCQLKLAGKLDEANGIAIGYFKSLNTSRPFFPGGSFTIKQVLDQILLPLDKPIIIGLPIGHVSDKMTAPIGAQAEMDATKKIFTITGQSVEC